MLSMIQAKFQAGYILESSTDLNVMQWKSILNDCLGKIINVTKIDEKHIRFHTPHCPRKAFPPFITIKTCGLGLFVKEAYQIDGQQVSITLIGKRRFSTIFMTYADMEFIRIDMNILKPRNNIMKVSEASYSKARLHIKSAININFDDNFDFIMENQIRRYNVDGTIYRHRLANECLLNTDYLEFPDNMKETSFYEDYKAFKKRMLNNAVINKFLDFEEEK